LGNCSSNLASRALENGGIAADASRWFPIRRLTARARTRMPSRPEVERTSEIREACRRTFSS
jgi:hypothetical protein